MTGVQSVERAIVLLTEVANRPSGLVELASAAELPTSTAARLLATLEGVDALRRDDEGVYRIGPAISALGTADDFEPSLRGVAYPFMEDLAATLDEAVGVSIPSGYDVVTIAQVDTPRPVQAENWEGTRWPIYMGGSGFALMATWPTAEIEAYQAAEPEAHHLLKRIEAARTADVFWSRDDYVEGLSSAAVAITDSSGRAVATLYVYGPSYRFPGDGDVEVIGAELTERARRISRAWTARTNVGSSDDDRDE